MVDRKISEQELHAKLKASFRNL